MDERPFRPRRIFEVLARQEVRYVVIGGFAAILHGSPVATNDADICPAGDDDNLRRLASALSELDARIATPDDPEGVPFPHDPDFIGRVQVWNLVTVYGRFDIAFRPSGTQGFDDLRRHAVSVAIGDGVVVPVASLLDIIRSKEAAGRDKDRRALPTLRRLLEELDKREH